MTAGSRYMTDFSHCFSVTTKPRLNLLWGRGSQVDIQVDNITHMLP